MSFVPGKMIKEFEAEGKKVSLRYPKWEDLDHLHKYINSMVGERTFFARQKKVSRKDEIEWLSKTFKAMEKGDLIMIVAEVDGKVVGNAIVTKGEQDAKKHTGEFGIGIRKEYRRMGIGKELIETIIKIAKKEMGIRIVQLWCFSGNGGALKLYRKHGFREAGRIPKALNHYGKYNDEIIMYKEV